MLDLAGAQQAQEYDLAPGTWIWASLGEDTCLSLVPDCQALFVVQEGLAIAAFFHANPGGDISALEKKYGKPTTTTTAHCSSGATSPAHRWELPGLVVSYEPFSKRGCAVPVVRVQTQTYLDLLQALEAKTPQL